MNANKFAHQFGNFLEIAGKLAKAEEADAIVVMIEEATDWGKLKKKAGKQPLIVLAGNEEQIAGIEEHEIAHVVLDMESAPVFEKLSQGLLEAVADEILPPGANVIAGYSGFDASQIDSISFIELNDHLGRLTARDLQNLETKVPLDTLKTVVDLAVDIGREGREGKPVGTLFVVGDTRKVLEHANDSGVDPFRGYNKKHRNLLDAKVQDDAKEIAQLDGAFVINSDGVIERSRQMLEVSHEDLTMTKGLGARHWASAAISRKTKAISVVVSQSTGTVRLYQNGHLVIRIEPIDKAVKWQEFAFEPPSQNTED